MEDSLYDRVCDILFDSKEYREARERVKKAIEKAMWESDEDGPAHREAFAAIEAELDVQEAKLAKLDPDIRQSLQLLSDMAVEEAEQAYQKAVKDEKEAERDYRCADINFQCIAAMRNVTKVLAMLEDIGQTEGKFTALVGRLDELEAVIGALRQTADVLAESLAALREQLA